MINASQLRDLIIKPALQDLSLLSDDAVELLLFTCAVESNGGTFLKQFNGPALGIYQMEPNTHNDIWQNFLKGRQSLLSMLITNFHVVQVPSEDRLVYDLRYASAMCRIHYERIHRSLPSAKDEIALWDYYKTYYNTLQGAALKDESIEKYRAFVKA